MAQVKIYGLKKSLAFRKQALSDEIHACLVEALKIPSEKKFQRFIGLEEGDFIFPKDRTDAYTLVEISLFEGRDKTTLKHFLQLLMSRAQSKLQMRPEDLEITMTESPRHCWGIRGKTGDELQLSYSVNV